MTRKIEIYENDLKQILTALRTCGESGYVDIDRDWVRTFWYNTSEVATALDTVVNLLTQETPKI
jgi:hypothetical protein